MNYYPFHIGDYATHTAHLEPLEDLAYRRLLDLYYLREGPLPSDIQECARLVRLRSHVEVVEAVLKEFFLEYPSGWINERCDAELSRMLEKQAKAKASAEASVNARKAKAERTLNERSTTVELPTPTPTPTPIPIPTPKSSSTKKSKTAFAKPVDVSDVVWISFLTNCRAKQKPPTDLVMLKIRAEAAKAGITLEQALVFACERSWARFEHEWWVNENNKQGQQRFTNPADVARVTVEGSKERDPALVKIDEDAKKASLPSPELRMKMQALIGNMKVKP